MNSMIRKNGIPSEFRSCFWDTDFDALDIEKNSAFIISRLYKRGGFRGIFWLEGVYRDQDIIDAAKTRRDLDDITANYLSKKYRLRREDMAFYQIPESIRAWR